MNKEEIEARLAQLKHSAQLALDLAHKMGRRHDALDFGMRPVKEYFDDQGESLNATNAGLALGRMTMAKSSIDGLINDLENYARLADQLRKEIADEPKDA